MLGTPVATYENKCPELRLREGYPALTALRAHPDVPRGRLAGKSRSVKLSGCASR